jgi:Double-GTPase 2
MPEITITMLGDESSGKTMYLLGLYAVMSAGLDGYTLHARDLNLDLDLTEAWDALVEKGERPPLTNEPKPYPLAFRQGFTRLIDINWLDYRGGTMTSREEPENTQELVAQLARSDSIYLTVDGSKLVGGVREENILDMRRATRANRMLTLWHQAAEERGGPPPSTVVLITKADLLIADAASPSAALDEAVDSVRLLLPAAFHQGTTTMVCPVTLGDLGDPEGGRIDPAKVSPRWVQKPIVFSLVRYFQDERARTSEELRGVRDTVEAEERGLTELRASAFGGFRKGRGRELAARVDAARNELDEKRQLIEISTDRSRRLHDQLEGPRFFVDGDETEFVRD